MDSFTQFDPETLPEELRPLHRQLLGDYTRKTQTLAEQRKQYEEQFGDIESAQTAVELLQSLGTPEGALSFYGLLGEQLQSLGLQQTAVAPQVQQPAVEQQQAPSFEDDPEAFLRWEQQQTRDELQALRDEIAAERTAASQEAAYFQLAGEIARQEALIRDSNPHYTDTQINAIYTLAPSFGGDLTQAQGYYEQLMSDSMASLLGNKQRALADTGAHPVSVPSESQRLPEIQSLDQAHAMALEHLRQLEVQDV